MNRAMRAWAPWIGGIVAVSALLSAVDRSGSGGLSGLPSYLVITALCAVLVAAVWKHVVGPESNRGLLIAVAAAVVLRLGLGVAFTYLLPEFGYPTRHQQEGYFFPDAFTRDLDAWQLASSRDPLVTALVGGTQGDQYGGLVYVSAFIYRYLTPGVHRPLLVVEVGAVVSALAVVFTWGLASRIADRKSGALAAWIVALYPEMVLLSASQMREPFIGTSLAMALYGYLRLRQSVPRAGAALVAAGVILGVLISPPYGFLVAGIMVLVWLWEGGSDPRRTAWALALLGAAGLGAFALTIRAWSSISEAPRGGLLDLLSWWLSAGARYQVHLLEEGSGMVQMLFGMTPEWAHMPMATGYGLLRPFFPATLTEPAAPLARAVEIWRSTGWTVLLPFLIYAPFPAFGRRHWRSLPAFFAALVWGTAILASYRAGGDGWDNVRYRAVFLAAQAGLAAWAWAHVREVHSPWLQRTGVLVAGVTLLFLQWYAGRYFGTPRLDLWFTLAAVVVYVSGLLAGSAILDRRRERGRR